jgi:hypothetical protein
MSRDSVVIPCEPFEAKIYDIMQDKTVKARVIGYRVAIRELRTPPDAIFTPIDLASGAKHGIIAVPEWESLEPNPLTQVSASPQEG